ncbi:hypothetical protein EGW08_015759 [Elysia chlorotica]|uniref:XPG-I domain-containing protein n=1 Tax=Elysia chlorotica TaxID=188477 RepID=A0A433T4K4_ELYCH|nr:hypothetical protein EGW08_015759 [Elysia chlorotica]
MGIAGLWSLLEPVIEEVYLKECCGKRIAVDLSEWIVQCKSIPVNSQSGFESNTSFFVNRGLFFRALNLSKLGIILVFVMDGPQAPSRKGRYNRHLFVEICQQHKALFRAMGFLVLEANGEAEKLCAELNLNNLVDGVLSSDGDAIVYGAPVVYKGMFTDKKEQKASKFTMGNIVSKLQMDRNDLVTFALLSKGDISDGVHSVGEKRIHELLKELKNNGVKDSLERLKSWPFNAELISLEDQSHRLNEIQKSTHCTLCCHEGTKSKHSRAGCLMCQMDQGCLSSKEASDMKPALCVCQSCCIERNLNPYALELKIRRLALQQDANFPSEEIIREFLSPCNKLPESSSVRMSTPDFQALYKILLEKLRFPKVQAAKYIIPWTIMMAFNGILTGVAVEPVRILKSCTEQFEKCYRVKWSKLDFDDVSEETDNYYEVNMSSSLFAAKYPDLVKGFEKDKGKPSQKGKRKPVNDPYQRKLSDMFKVVKRSEGKNESVAKPTDMSRKPP